MAKMAKNAKIDYFDTVAMVTSFHSNQFISLESGI